MTGRDAIKNALTSTQNILNMYLGDLSDADLLVRPVAGANHIAWQLGHLIGSEVMFVAKEFPGADTPKLPDGWDKQHGKDTSAQDPPKGFSTKAQYLELFGKARQATLAVLAKSTDADLDKATSGPMAKWAPTTGALFLLIVNHTMMHAGQFTVVRRKLGKPVLF